MTIDGVDSTVYVSREGPSTKTGIEHVDEVEIFEGRENKITMSQTYSKSFHCTYRLQYFPFDSQVRTTLGRRDHVPFNGGVLCPLGLERLRSRNCPAET